MEAESWQVPVGSHFIGFGVNFILSSRYEVRTIIRGVWPLCPHGYGMILSLTFAECLAEVLSPLRWPWGTTDIQDLSRCLGCLAKRPGLPGPGGLTPSIRQARAWPAKAAALSLSIFLNLTQPSQQPLPQPSGTNCSLFCVPTALCSCSY